MLITRRRFLGTQLREYSRITWFFERIFWAMHLASPSRFFATSRVTHVNSDAFRDDPYAATMRRARRTENYLIGWIVIEGGLVVLSAMSTALPAWIPAVLVTLRILDIFQSAVNLSVFDKLRTEESIVISSAVRTLVLSFLNYLELLVCFGILYASMIDRLNGAQHWTDAFYFSVVTQLTIGYGDIKPLGIAKLVTMAQALISVAFTILIFGRIVSVLPRINSVLTHEGKD